ncbi:hypothetical protein DSL72_002625 [Monilinia vaccinii-corymbosi]|uniref:Developmental regulatory protein wetA n=1 Tax=Monilinia vaccinii-corymbosi TaxID=61207 RepID=A0A8A3PD74_9HELO|nr:hypothetical protein DSL72_002625 [Monilinia vaccinii-corymbosi]
MSPPMATGGKSLEFLTHPYDELDNALFDEFITFSPTHDGFPAPDFFEPSDSKDQSSEAFMGSLHDAHAQEIEDNWQGDPWVFAQDATSPDGTQDNLFYAELSGRAAISDSDLLGLEDISLQTPQIDAWAHPSLPTSPTPAASTKRKCRVEALANTLKKVRTKSEKSLRSPIRKSSTTSSAILRGSSSHRRMSRETSRRKMALDASKFGFNPQHQSPMSPPQSAGISNASEHTASMKKAQKTKISEELWTGRPQDLQLPSVPVDYHTPISTPNLDHKHTPEMRFHQSLSNGSMYPITPKSRQVSASWSQLAGSPSFGSIGASSKYPVEVKADGDSLWWNHAASPLAQPSPNTLHRNTQRATKSLAFHLQNELSYTTNDMNMAQGLMISMPENLPQQSFVVESPPTMLHPGYFHAGENGGGPQPHSPYHNAAPRTPHSHHPHDPSSSSSSSSRKPHHAMNARPRRPRTGSSGSESPSPHAATGVHVRKQRRAKSRNASPKTPTAASGRGGMIDFVNYTPDDSRKILTGVAPSGSSKTKARREKEAMENRRKLSQAALNAIRAAGGDVGSLVEEGLFV